MTNHRSKYLDNRIDRGHLQGIHTADVVVVQTLQDFRRWKAEGKLLRYKPATFEDILYAEKDPDGYFMAQAISMGTGTTPSILLPMLTTGL